MIWFVLDSLLCLVGWDKIPRLAVEEVARYEQTRRPLKPCKQEAPSQPLFVPAQYNAWWWNTF